MKKLSIVLSLFAFCGCATTMSNPFGDMYNNAVSQEASIIIIKEGEFKAIDAKVTEHLKNLHYSHVIYSKPEEGFLVLVKDTSLVKSLFIGDAHPCKIILKYTKAGEGKTRIDLVRGSNSLMTNGEVDKDIQALTDLIKKD